MDIKLLEDFICLGSLQSFTAAARERNISQSALSRRVKSLENWLGAELIDRNFKQFNLTPRGRIFFPEAEVILRQIYNAREAVRTIDLSGNLEIAVASQNSIAQTLFPEWVRYLESTLGILYVRLVSEKLSSCIELLDKGDVNYLFCYAHKSLNLPINENKFSYCIVGKETLIPVSAAFKQKALVELPGQADSAIPYVAYTHNSLFGKTIDHLIQQKTHQCYLSRRYENAYSHTLKSLVKEGLGLAWLPASSTIPELKSGELMRAGDQSWDIELDIRLYYNKNARNASDKVILDTSIAFAATRNKDIHR